MTRTDRQVIPRLAEGICLQRDRLDGQPLLLHPEGVVKLNPTGAAILALCDGSRNLEAVVATLAVEYPGADDLPGDVTAFLAEMAGRQWVLWSGPIGGPTARQEVTISEAPREGPRPLGLIAELTYRCPLHCPYCSNPTGLPAAGRELDPEEWARVFGEAADLGVLHALLSGGEPLLRDDLQDLVASARSAGLYTNLITSGVGLSAGRAEALKRAGLDSVQISLQGDEPPLADSIAGASAHSTKLRAARAIRSLGLPLTLNVVLHRLNIGRVGRMIALAESLGAYRLELASAQYYGWAFANRDALLPGEEDVRAAETVAAEAADRLRGRMEVLFVLPDYFADRPKPCMHGWGRRYLTVNPVGEVLPCPTAGAIPGLLFENLRGKPLAEIWRDSEAFNRFRGTAWMPEPCRSCRLREVDFGGCRCQAALLTGDPANTDPACSLAPHRGAIESARMAGRAEVPSGLIYRSYPAGRASSGRPENHRQTVTWGGNPAGGV